MLFKKRIYLTRYEEFFYNLKNKKNKKNMSKTKRNAEDLRNTNYQPQNEEIDENLLHKQMQLMMKTPRKKFWVRRGNSVQKRETPE